MRWRRPRLPVDTDDYRYWLSFYQVHGGGQFSFLAKDYSIHSPHREPPYEQDRRIVFFDVAGPASELRAFRGTLTSREIPCWDRFFRLSLVDRETLEQVQIQKVSLAEIVAESNLDRTDVHEQWTFAYYEPDFSRTGPVSHRHIS